MKLKEVQEEWLQLAESMTPVKGDDNRDYFAIKTFDEWKKINELKKKQFLVTKKKEVQELSKAEMSELKHLWGFMLNESERDKKLIVTYLSSRGMEITAIDQ